MRSSHSRVSSAILRTLAYSARYHYPLSLSELHTRLVDVQIDRSKLVNVLQTLCLGGAVLRAGNWYTLPTGATYFRSRREANRISVRKHHLAKHYAKLLIRLPFVSAIFLTGSVAVRNSHATDDLDLMIITEPHRLWLARFIITLYCELAGIRRRPHATRQQDLVCLNLYLSRNQLTIPAEKHTLYSAYELIQAQPLSVRTTTRAALLAANPWVSTFLPNYHIRLSPQLQPTPTHNIILDWLDYCFFRLQLRYMHHHQTTEYVTQNVAFFHPRAETGVRQ